MDRLDYAHLVTTKILGDKLYVAPIEEKNIHQVLDIGTGTGLCKFFSRTTLDSSRARMLTCDRGNRLCRSFPSRRGEFSPDPFDIPPFSTNSVKDASFNCDLPVVKVHGIDLSAIQPEWWVFST